MCVESLIDRRRRIARELRGEKPAEVAKPFVLGLDFRRPSANAGVGTEGDELTGGMGGEL